VSYLLDTSICAAHIRRPAGLAHRFVQHSGRLSIPTIVKLRGILKPLGVAVNPVDLQIAAVAIAHNLTLVTNNTKHFQSIPGLALEDWLTP
jgi:tRNA(fMet)-specific endonuclease VapC